MRTQTTDTPKAVSTTELVLQTQTSLAYSSELSYHELAEIPVQQVNPVEQLRANMAKLSELQARLQFMTKEIRYLMKI